MESDQLRLFNTGRVNEIVSIKDDETLWNYVLANEEKIKYLTSGGIHFASGFLYGYSSGLQRLKEFFEREVEYYRDGVIFSLVMDFCFEGEKIALDYYARCGFLDSPDSCDVKTSDLVMPYVDEDSDEFYYKKYFHLLEPHHVEGIIRAMEKNFDKLTVNTRKDIAKIKRMRKFCLKNEGWNVAYIFDI